MVLLKFSIILPGDFSKTIQALLKLCFVGFTIAQTPQFLINSGPREPISLYEISNNEELEIISSRNKVLFCIYNYCNIDDTK